jgi:hypothetical protein
MKKKISFEKVGFQRFPIQPKPNRSGHGYSFPERQVSDSSRSEDLEEYVQLAKTHYKQISTKSLGEI